MIHQLYEKVHDEGQTQADPQKGASIFSHLTFWWMNRVFQTGAKRPLEEADFLPLQEEDETQRLTEKIWKLWSCEKKNCASSGRQPRLWNSTLKALSLRQNGLALLAGLVDSTCRLLKALVLAFLLLELMSVQDDKRSFLYLYAAAIFLAAVIGNLAAHYCNYHLSLIGMRLKAAFKGVVYRKVSKLNCGTLSKRTRYLLLHGIMCNGEKMLTEISYVNGTPTLDN